ncbi:GIY-YIG nuclease family protein [Kitasatospora purpeofusca]|uniref:GIY-YIG nuclease family protein n=1 Tax=Kitasatospora purpeofusca TaxID=67352 RepID=UPI0035E341CA
MSESQYAACFAELEVGPEQLEGHREERARESLLRRLRTEDEKRDSVQALIETLIVEWLALRRLGPVAEQPRIPDRSHLYVLSFVGARSFVKVGRTIRFAERLREHRAKAERQGDVLFDAWASEPVDDAYPWEQAVLRALRSRHDPFKVEGERFYDLDYAEARTVVDQQRICVSPRSVGLTVPRQRSA